MLLKWNMFSYSDFSGIFLLQQGSYKKYNILLWKYHWYITINSSVEYAKYNSHFYFRKFLPFSSSKLALYGQGNFFAFGHKTVNGQCTREWIKTIIQEWNLIGGIIQGWNRSETALQESSWLPYGIELEMIGCQYQHMLIHTYVDSKKIHVSRV